MTDMPIMRAAFRTTVSGGGKYEMVFRFANMEDMHAADDEWREALAAPARTDDAGVGDSVIAAKAREALGTWLAWPDAPRDGPRPVTNEQVESWLHGIPARLAALQKGPSQ